MSKTRGALILLLSIGALLAFLLLLIPRRPDGEPAAARDGASQRTAEGAPEQTAARQGEATREAPYPVPEKEPAPLPAEEPRSGAVARAVEPRGRPARVAIVIDDAGYSLVGLKEFLGLPYPLAFSVLPGLPRSREAGRLIVEAGRELLVHLPMEPEGGADPGPGAVGTGQSDREIERLLEESLELLPQAVGMNNHMGSRATADRRVMEVVLGFLRDHGLFFLDSKTTASTLGPQIAGELGVALLERQVFLDNESSPAYIRQALERGIRAAEQRGSAVLIGHVQNLELAEELGKLLPELEREGIEVVPPSALAAGSRGRP